MTGRIRERAAFERLRTEGRRAGHGVLWCTWVENPSDAVPRVGFAIGRNVGGAVVRNRVRRRLRALLHEQARKGRLRPGDYLLGARPGAAAAAYRQLSTDLDAVLAKLGDPGG